MIRLDIVSVCRNGYNVLLLTIQQQKHIANNGEGEFILRKLLISQDSVVLYFGFISPSLSITSLLVIGVVWANHLYAGVDFSNTKSLKIIEDETSPKLIA